ncbi:MAG TPA: sigma factor-like helix-turn-helix DNA-binding protein, partial [Blastocatellia bacterium]|nr:sigma factor-like helix-turn-helix DNA-binding protein [Blastocatellia bacterium]
ETVAYEAPPSPELRDEEMLAALAAVPQNYRAVVLLADVQEFSYKEIAGILKVPVGTVMSRLSRGRDHLRKALDKSCIAAGFAASSKWTGRMTITA